MWFAPQRIEEHESSLLIDIRIFNANKLYIALDYSTKYKVIFNMGFHILTGKKKKSSLLINFDALKINPEKVFGDGHSAEGMVGLLSVSL